MVPKSMKTVHDGKPFHIISSAHLKAIVARAVDLDAGDFIHPLGDALIRAAVTI